MRAWIFAALSVASIFCASPSQAQQVPAPSGQSERVTDPAQMPRVFAVQVRVADLDRSERFYREGLGATNVVRVHDRERFVRFASGASIVLVQGAAREPDAAPPQGAGGFLLQVADIDAVIGRVAGAGGAVVSQPNSGQGALSFGVRAGVIRDPDGVNIEVIQFPAGGPRQP